MDAYEQHDLEKVSEVSMSKRTTERKGAMTTTAKINSHIFEIESLCHQFCWQVQAENVLANDAPEMDYDFCKILQELMRLAYAQYQRRSSVTAGREATLKDFGKLWALSSASKRKWDRTRMQRGADSITLDSQIFLDTVDSNEQMGTNVINLDWCNHVEPNTQMETDVNSLDLYNEMD